MMINKFRGTSVRQGGSGKQAGNSGDDSDVDPRLKNFEPRMLELIMSEVSSLHPSFSRLVLNIETKIFLM